MYLSRHCMEQKWTNSLPFRSGMAIVSAMCIPQTGSRTNFRAAESGGTTTSGCLFKPPIPMFPTTRRNSATLQETISIQNTKRRIRPIYANKLHLKRGTAKFQPVRPLSGECMQGKKGRQTKMSKFNGLREERLMARKSHLNRNPQ
jgi:hypothetical protein